MPHRKLDRSQLRILPLGKRPNRVDIEYHGVSPDKSPVLFVESAREIIDETLARILAARENGRPVVLAFGAHAIKNGLGQVLIRLMENGWLTHLATNGAGIIHDWEFAFQGKSSENVQTNIEHGQFGIWEETGFFINLALLVGAFEGLGYGESIGAMIEKEGLEIPDSEELKAAVHEELETDPERCAAAVDLLVRIRQFDLKAGWLAVPHPYKSYSVQAAAYRLNIPFTGHPMFGQDIIYNHPMNHGAAVGRTSLRDFLSFAESIRNLEGGVYLSIGSAVMSPMIFEKAFSMARNLEIQEGRQIENHFILVVDLAEAVWDWQTQGEPPTDHPAYYMRYCKTFSRMGGTMRYLCADNRDVLLTFHQELARITH